MNTRRRFVPGFNAAKRLAAYFLLLLAGLVVSSSRHPPTLGWNLAAVARNHSFDLWTWEIDTLAQRTAQGLWASNQHVSSADGIAVVRQYAALSAQEERALSRRDGLWAQRAVTGQAPGLRSAERQAAVLESEVATQHQAVEAIVSQQIDTQLHRDGVQSSFLRWTHLDGFPFLRPTIVPRVFFQLGPLPNLLVVSPRDRIELVGSVLIQPGLGPDEVNRLENQAESLGVSSVVTGIGGLAAYPSMRPDDPSIRDLLITVAHEWTHHYLALHPLGMAYFNSYSMREINETVADMVGHEVGDAVYVRYYGKIQVPSSSSSSASRSTGPSFLTLMRRIRVRVVRLLAKHDVTGAEAYMASARLGLARQGYYISRLNTAYLAFFGSYAGTGNPYEGKLRLLRSRCGTLADFLEVVSQVHSPGDLDRELASPGCSASVLK